MLLCLLPDDRHTSQWWPYSRVRFRYDVSTWLEGWHCYSARQRHQGKPVGLSAKIHYTLGELGWCKGVTADWCLLQFRMTEFGTLEIVTEMEPKEQVEAQDQPVTTSTSQAPSDAQLSLAPSQAECQGQPGGQHQWNTLTCVCFINILSQGFNDFRC